MNYGSILAWSAVGGAMGAVVPYGQGPVQSTAMAQDFFGKAFDVIA